MSHLNLHESQRWHTVEIKETNGNVKEFKIPIELTVADTERMLAMYDEIDALQDEQIRDDGSAQLRLFKDKIFAMTLILFQVYQPDISERYLQDNLTYSDALTLTGFFQSNRFLKIKSENEKISESGKEEAN